MLLHEFSREAKLVVRLVDEGEVVVVEAAQVLACPPHLLQLPSLVFCCHLEGIVFIDTPHSRDTLADIVKSLPEDRIAVLSKEGKVVEKCFEQFGVTYTMASVPVDLSWEVNCSQGPFLPSKATQYSLKQLCQDRLGLGASDVNGNFYEEASDLNISLKEYPECDLNLEEIKEFADVKPLHDSSSFHWLPPELPGKESFSARGINVDISGQIYIQLSSQKHTVRLLKKLLNEKFSQSPPDEDTSPMVEGEACCVRWEDGCWYRASFVSYSDAARTVAQVFLVDYGNYFHCAQLRDNLRREIYAERLPVQALRVELAGATPLGPASTWTEEALDLMQAAITYERLPGKHSRIRLKVAGQKEKLPLPVSIQFEAKEKAYEDLGAYLEYWGHVKMGRTSHTREFRDIRAKMHFAMDAVQFGTYENNFYVLTHEASQLAPPQLEVASASQLRHIDWRETRFGPGDLLRLEVVHLADSRTVLAQPEDESDAHLAGLVAAHWRVVEESQQLCRNNPPVFQPRLGLLVAARYSEDQAWYRATLLGFTDTEYTVSFVDFGNQETVRDSLLVKELPEEMASLAVISVRVRLDIELREEEDIVHTLMKETLFSYEGKVALRISSLGDQGRVSGHLVNPTSGEIIYKNLISEGIIKAH